jgi:hypothetical protein
VSKKGASKNDENPFNTIGKKILKLDRSILSLTINDDKGEVLGKAFTPEYERKYFEAAKDFRSRAGLFSALIFGIASEPEKVFGEAKAIVRIYEDVKLILIPFSDRKLMATLLTKSQANTDQIIEETRPLLHPP